MRVPFRRFVGRTGGRRLAPHRAKRDFIGECFPQGRSGRSCVRLVSVLRRAYKLLPFDILEKIDVQIADRMSVETKITLGVGALLRQDLLEGHERGTRVYRTVGAPILELVLPAEAFDLLHNSLRPVA